MINKFKIIISILVIVFPILFIRFLYYCFPDVGLVGFPFTLIILFFNFVSLLLYLFLIVKFTKFFYYISLFYFIIWNVLIWNSHPSVNSPNDIVKKYCKTFNKYETLNVKYLLSESSIERITVAYKYKINLNKEYYRLNVDTFKEPILVSRENDDIFKLPLINNDIQVQNDFDSLIIFGNNTKIKISKRSFDHQSIGVNYKNNFWRLTRLNMKPKNGSEKIYFSFLEMKKIGNGTN